MLGTQVQRDEVRSPEVEPLEELACGKDWMSELLPPFGASSGVARRVESTQVTIPPPALRGMLGGMV